MQKACGILALFVLLHITACNNVNTTERSNQKENDKNKITVDQQASANDFKVNVEDLLKNSWTWYSYHYHNIHIAQNFIGLDEDSIEINKSKFLTLLTKGNFIPIKTSIKDDVPVYRLYKFDGDNTDIRTTITQAAFHELENYNREGKKFPSFNFTDLNGNNYSNTNTHNKIVVLKCWFIHCVACVKEFPELNKLVDEYKADKDVLFISLAMDSRKDLIKFLSTKQFKYAVIPQQKKYIINEMGISMFPTHILVDRKGKIVKVVNNIEELKPILKKEIIY